jgi:ubiquinone/menaquinone biosynthesis C-methylase UbiE
MDNTTKFSNRVENYIKFRPSYPSELIDFLYTSIGMKSHSVVADIGSGTGIFTKLLLDRNNKVFAVEPNTKMRAAAEKLLSKYAKLVSVKGTAENTTLTASSIDFIVSAQAFHWFDKAQAQKEFSRIIRPNGQILLVWNKRIKDRIPFLIDYEGLVRKYAKGYEKESSDVQANELAGFFKGPYNTRVFSYTQQFNLEQLTGRLLSSSYAPLPDDDSYRPMLEELRSIFDKYNENGVVAFEYETVLYWGNVYIKIPLLKRGREGRGVVSEAN